MMVHLFLNGKVGSKVFKRMGPAQTVPPREEDLEKLYMLRDNVGVGFFETRQQFVTYPIHRVDEIRFTRAPGEPWTG